MLYKEFTYYDVILINKQTTGMATGILIPENTTLNNDIDNAMYSLNKLRNRIVERENIRKMAN